MRRFLPIALLALVAVAACDGGSAPDDMPGAAGDAEPAAGAPIGGAMPAAGGVSGSAPTAGAAPGGTSSAAAGEGGAGGQGGSDSAGGDGAFAGESGQAGAGGQGGLGGVHEPEAGAGGSAGESPSTAGAGGSAGAPEPEVCECSEGPCCDGCHVRPRSHFCGEAVRESWCSGNSVHKEYWNLFCDGVTADRCTRWAVKTKYALLSCGSGESCTTMTASGEAACVR